MSGNTKVTPDDLSTSRNGQTTEEEGEALTSSVEALTYSDTGESLGSSSCTIQQYMGVSNSSTQATPGSLMVTNDGGGWGDGGGCIAPMEPVDNRSSVSEQSRGTPAHDGSLDGVDADEVVLS